MMPPAITITPELWCRRPSELCQLAGVWKGETCKGWLIEQKHDGWRMNWRSGETRTRQGMPFRGVSHIERALALLEAQFGEPMMIDGEFVVGTGPDTLAQTKAHQDSGWKAGNAGVMHVFDALPLSQWKADDCDTPLIERKNALEGAFMGMCAAPEAWEMGWGDGVACPLALVEHDIAANEYTIDRIARGIWEQGGEGVVIKDPAAPYRRQRTSAWLKHKKGK